jgi:hypothetical protein
MNDMNWNQALQTMAQGNGYGDNDERLEAARWMVQHLNTNDPDGTLDWLIEGNWSGNETRAGIQQELSAIEAIAPR